MVTVLSAGSVPAVLVAQQGRAFVLRGVEAFLCLATLLCEGVTLPYCAPAVVSPSPQERTGSCLQEVSLTPPPCEVLAHGKTHELILCVRGPRSASTLFVLRRGETLCCRRCPEQAPRRVFTLLVSRRSR